jgi:hypothetical protein
MPGEEMARANADRWRRAERAEGTATPRVARALLIASLGAIAVLTLTPTAGPSPRAPAWCLSCNPVATADAIANVALFVPLGVALALLRSRLPRAFLIALVTTSIVEVVQHFLVQGRDGTLRDVLANTLGSVVGWLVAARWHRLSHPTPRAARRLGAVAALSLALIVVATIAAIAPDVPARPLWVQIAPVGVYPSAFGGRVEWAEIGGARVHEGRVDDPASLRRRLESLPLDVRVDALSGAPTPSLASIVSVYDDGPREILLVGQRHGDLVVRMRVRGTRWLLRTPLALVDGALSGRPSVPTTLRVHRTPSRWDVEVRTPGEARAHAAALTPGVGWMLVLPALQLWRAATLVVALWIALLCFPVAYWGRLALERNGQALAAFSAIAACLLGALPWALGAAPAGLAEWIGATGGGALGLVLAARAVSRQRSAEIASATRSTAREMRS